jgi:hypothetical protein
MPAKILLLATTLFFFACAANKNAKPEQQES